MLNLRTKHPRRSVSEVLIDDDDIQLLAHGPDGDGAVSAVGAEAEGLTFEPEVEVPAPSVPPLEAEEPGEDEPE